MRIIDLFKHKKDVQQEWQDKTCAYADAINAFIEKGLHEGWDEAGDQPDDNKREPLVPHLLRAIREANASDNPGALKQLRDAWPLAHGPLIPMLDKNEQDIPMLCLLDNGDIIARIGAVYKEGHVVQIRDRQVIRVEGIEYFGISPNRKYVAIAKADGVSITQGWQGIEVCFCPWPTGKENIPAGYEVNGFIDPPIPTQLIPFPDGKRVLLVSSEGIFVLMPDRAQRLLPTTESMKDHFEWLQEDDEENELGMGIDMEHGAVSPDGKWIAVGSQDSYHHVFDSDLNEAASVGNQSEYPHYAIFSSDGEMIAFNSCHFYNGITVGVPTKFLPGLDTNPYEEDSRTPILEDMSRVYAGVSRGDEFIIGDATGYIRAFDRTGKFHWQYFIGSSIGAIDLSSDGKTLVVSTYAGFISIMELDAGQQTPCQIGNSKHDESRRWLFWKEEKQPLIW